MQGLRISRIEIQGFRAFGQNAQTIVLSPTVSAIWGPNSQGKTSLAEAFEFLLTGHTVRRELLASAQDEFADALRNAHMPGKTAVFVQAEIIGTDGVPHILNRTLTADYGKKQDCQTALQIDGKPATESALAAFGIVLSQPPLQAPVLAQHTLGYLFSARPQDRANYFKALLEVTDLEAFRSGVVALESDVKAQDHASLRALDVATSIPEVQKALGLLRAFVPNPAEIEEDFADATGALLSAAGEAPPSDPVARLARLEQLLAEKRAHTFPVKAFEKQPLAVWTPPPQSLFTALERYVGERVKVNEETRRLTKLFTEALALPGIADATSPIDCPLCATQGGLAPHRIAHIRERAKDTTAFRDAERGALEALTELAGILEASRKVIDDAVPKFMLVSPTRRRERSFSLQRIRALLGETSVAAVADWLRAARRLARARSTTMRLVKASATEIAGHANNLDSLGDATPIRVGLTALSEALRGFADALALYVAAEKPVAEQLKAVVDTASKTTGWQELIDLAKDQPGLRVALIEAAIRDQASKELEQALRQIDKGNETVLEAKFKDLSAAVSAWWNLLRPNEPSFFAAVGQRAGTRRTVDFKAGLSTKPDRSNAKLRDVIAVFSQSQMHCLGLAVFLARSIHERAGFIVLDDPILSSDEDYRSFFTTSVLEKLMADGIQVILLTQDQKTWKDVGTLYLHNNVAQFNLALMDPNDGTVVWNTANDLRARLIRLETAVRNNHPAARKQTGGDLRDATERFCKEILVKERRDKGDRTAAISEYDNKNLSWLSPKVELLLSNDPSHPGKLRKIVSDLNPANHDDDIPSSGALTISLRNLSQFTKEYLGS